METGLPFLLSVGGGGKEGLGWNEPPVRPQRVCGPLTQFSSLRSLILACDTLQHSQKTSCFHYQHNRPNDASIGIGSDPSLAVLTMFSGAGACVKKRDPSKMLVAFWLLVGVNPKMVPGFAHHSKDGNVTGKVHTGDRLRPASRVPACLSALISQGNDLHFGPPLDGGLFALSVPWQASNWEQYSPWMLVFSKGSKCLFFQTPSVTSGRALGGL